MPDQYKIPQNINLEVINRGTHNGLSSVTPNAGSTLWNDRRQSVKLKISKQTFKVTNCDLRETQGYGITNCDT